MEKSLLMLLAEEDEAVKEYNASRNIIESDLKTKNERLIQSDTERLLKDKERMENARLAIAEYFRKLTKY